MSRMATPGARSMALLVVSQALVRFPGIHSQDALYGSFSSNTSATRSCIASLPWPLQNNDQPATSCATACCQRRSRNHQGLEYLVPWPSLCPFLSLDLLCLHHAGSDLLGGRHGVLTLWQMMTVARASDVARLLDDRRIFQIQRPKTFRGPVATLRRPLVESETLRLVHTFKQLLSPLVKHCKEPMFAKS